MTLIFKAAMPLKPTPKGRPRMTRTGHVFTPAKTRSAEKEIRDFCLENYPGEPYGGPCAINVEFRFVKPKSNIFTKHVQRPDLDNILKLVSDAMNGIIYSDDCQIVEIHATKVWALTGEPAQIIVEVIGHEQIKNNIRT